MQESVAGVGVGEDMFGPELLLVSEKTQVGAEVLKLPLLLSILHSRDT